MSKHFLNKFSKYQGAGNDFILIDDRALSFDTTQIPTLCHRKFGIGADGVILLQPSQTADFRMRIFNSDGSEAESCGNGLRCLTRFISDLGLPKSTYRIATQNQIVEASFLANQIKINLGPIPTSTFHSPEELHFLNTGVPHAVLFVPNPEMIDIAQEGSRLRHHSLFQPKGTNVNFAAIQKDGSIHVRTYERGIEGETFACGTGAAAVAVIAHQKHNISSPIQIQFAGGNIEIHLENGQISMVGDATKTFEGFF